MARLKVFVTPAGFHDAYVAAPSRKAALAAWGSDHDLFARGIASQVTDPALTAAPLADPGTVIRLSRGNAAAQIAALPPDVAHPGAKPAGRPATSPTPKPPKPGSAARDAARDALDAATDRTTVEAADLAREREAIERRERDLARRTRDELADLQRRLDEEEDAYATALRAWRAA